jgi:hypothetical protein
MLRHFGLECSEQTQSFTDSLYEIQARGDRAPSKTGWGDMYFNVFRNSRKEKDAWRKKISAEDRRKIEAIVGDSEAVAYGATLGEW